MRLDRFSRWRCWPSPGRRARPTRARSIRTGAKSRRRRPRLQLDGLIPLEMPRSAPALRRRLRRRSPWAATASCATWWWPPAPSGAVNALYEGIRCNTGEYKVYARHNPGSGWVVAKDSQWRPLHAAPSRRHALIIARTGACVGHGTDRLGRQDRQRPARAGRTLRPAAIAVERSASPPGWCGGSSRARRRSPAGARSRSKACGTAGAPRALA